MDGAWARGGNRGRIHRGFGLRFRCTFPLEGLPTHHPGPADVSVQLAELGELERAWSGPAPEPAVVELSIDGLAYRAERGAAGDHRFFHGDRAAFLLSADCSSLLCWAADPAEPGWRRTLLDSVLATVSLLHGHEALHASAVLAREGAVAFIGRTGGGKTTLAAELMRRELPLFCDDILALSRDLDGQIVGHPAPPVMNLPAGAPAPAGRVLATMGGETWLAVDGAAGEPAPLATVCLIDRRPGAAAAVAPAPAGPLELLAHGLRSGNAPERRQARFELLADLAARVPTYVLQADTRTSAATLADLLESAVPALASAREGALR